MPSTPSTSRVPVTHMIQRAQAPWHVLVQIWTKRYPPEQPRSDAITLVVKLAATPVLIMRCFMVVSLLSRGQAPSRIDAIVLGWTALTCAVLVFPSLRGIGEGALLPPVVAVGLVWYRIADTLSQKLMEILVHSLRRPLFAGSQRSLLLSALNLFEIFVCYAILYLANGGVRHDKEMLSTATSSLYFSVVTGLTVGYGDFVPTTDSARRLVMSEMAVVAVFVIAWFPSVAGFLFPSSTSEERSATP